jgi:DNA gyrase/topoisomerase IV subunit A
MLFFVSSDGRGKRISVAAFAQQSRAGRGKKGIGLMKGSKLTALCLTGLDSDEHEHVIIGSQGGVMNRYDVASIRPQSGRAAKGVNVMKLSDDDTVRDLTLLPAELGEDE